MPLTRFALNNPVAATLFFIVIMLSGAAAVMMMGRSILPPIALPVITVSAPYPGAAAAEIERLVIEPIEDQVSALPDVQHVDSSAQSGVAQISVQFRFGSNIEVDRTYVQQAVDAARANLPADLLPPLVSRGDPTQAPVLEEAISSELVAPGTLADTLSKNILPALRAVPGAGTVQTSGAQTRQFIIRPRSAALSAVGGTLLDLFGAAGAGNDVLPGGSLRTATSEANIGIDAAATGIAALGTLPLTVPGRASVRIADVARVENTYAEQSVISRVDGQPAVLVYVTHASGSDALHTIAGVRAAVRRLAQRFPAVRFEELRTDEPSTNAAIAGVFQTLGEGVLLTVLVMLFFLHAWRNALIAAIAIPASLCAAFATMWVLGLTLNVLSLMGLSLTIGILVDDSIVIIEAITRTAAGGLSADAAALEGRRELGGAAFAITLVDAAVFAPIAMMGGIVGEFMREFGLVIVIATAFSLLVALTLTPLLAARWALRTGAAPLDGLPYGAVLAALRKRAKTFPWTMRAEAVLRGLAAWHAAINWFNHVEQHLAETYARRWLPAAIRRPKTVVVAAAAICALSFVPLVSGAIPAEFSPPVNRGLVTMTLTLPAGTPLAQTDAAAQRVNQALLDDPAVLHVEESAGRAFNGSADVFAGNVAQLTMVLSDPTSNGGEVERRIKNMTALIPQATIAGAGTGMGGAAGISYTIGGDPAVIDAAAQRIAASLRSNPYATDVQTSDSGLRRRFEVDVDFSRSQMLGVSPDDVARTARIATGGSIAARAREDAGLQDVIVRAGGSDSGDLDALMRFPVRAGDGRLIPLEDLTRVRRLREPTIVQREDGERIVTVSANAQRGAPLSLVSAPIAKQIADPAFLPPGTRVEPRGDVEQFLDAVSKIFAALLFSLIGVYVILAVLYRNYTLPLVIMLTVPLASAGALGVLFMLNVMHVPSQTLNLYSMLGIVMLVGLVAKNGILLVEYAERAVRGGASGADAIANAAQLRLRPILMTTAAMIAGMLPLAAGHTIGAEYRRALGTVVIGGLSSSLLLTLFVVPVAYVWYRGAKAPRARTTVPYAIDGRELRRGA